MVPDHSMAICTWQIAVMNLELEAGPKCSTAMAGDLVNIDESEVSPDALVETVEDTLVVFERAKHILGFEALFWKSPIVLRWPGWRARLSWSGQPPKWHRCMGAIGENGFGFKLVGQADRPWRITDMACRQVEAVPIVQRITSGTRLTGTAASRAAKCSISCIRSSRASIGAHHVLSSISFLKPHRRKVRQARPAIRPYPIIVKRPWIGLRAKLFSQQPAFAIHNVISKNRRVAVPCCR